MTETHPFEPYIPEGAKYLIMGTFPPTANRWAFKFYYPNPTNDFWKVMGIVYYNDPTALQMPDGKHYDLDKIKSLLNEHGIAMSDTGYRVRRLMGNASDKYLEIVEPVNLAALLARMPECHTIITTGEKAAQVIADLTGTLPPKMGEMVETPTLRIWRMPSTSRAYPLAPAKKADYYRRALLPTDKA